MPSIKMKFEKLYLRPQAEVERTVVRYFLVGLRLAGRAFLIKAHEIVPVFTGMALGSLNPLANIVKYKIPIYGRPKDAWVNGQLVTKDESLGEKQGDAIIYKANARTAVLRVETKVYHYDLRDVNEMSDTSGVAAPTPWHSFAQGAAAASQEFNEYMDFKVGNFIVFAVKEKVKTSLTESPVEAILG